MSKQIAAVATRGDLVERARAEREQRAVLAVTQKAARKIFTFIKNATARRRFSQTALHELSTKLHQLRVFASALTSKGIVFCPPAAVLRDLLRSFLVAVAPYAFSQGLFLTPEVDLLANLTPWVLRSAEQASSDMNALCNPYLEACVLRLVIVMLLTLRRISTPRAKQTLLLDGIAALCRCRGDVPAPAVPAVAAAASERMRVHAVERLHFVTRAARPLCCALLRTDADAASISPSTSASSADCAVAAGAVELSIRLRCPDVFSQLLSIPFLVAFLEGSHAASLLRSDHTLTEALLAPAAEWCARGGALPAVEHVSGVVAVWPPELFLLGNVLQLVTEPASHGAHALAASALSVRSAGTLLRVIARCMACVPHSIWSGGTPILWVAPLVAPHPVSTTLAAAAAATKVTADQPSTTSTAAVVQHHSRTSASAPLPHRMPPLLAGQLRRLSGERLARALLHCCVWLDASCVRTPRLKLRPDEDPERASYEDSHSLEELLAALKIGGKGGDVGSLLSAAPSTPTAIFRGVWAAGSRLASTIFARRAAASERASHHHHSGGGSSSSAASHSHSSSSSTSSLSFSAAAAAVGAGPTVSDSVGHRRGTEASAHRGPVDVDAVYAYCAVYATLTAPTSTLSGSSKGSSSSEADDLVGRVYLLSTLAYTPSLRLSVTLWVVLVDKVGLREFVTDLAFRSKADPVAHGPWAVLALLTGTLGHLVPVLDDFELYSGHGLGAATSPTSSSASASSDGDALSLPSGCLPLRELRYFIRFLRDVLAHCEGIGVDAGASAAAAAALAAPDTSFWPRFRSSAVSLLTLLYDRHSARPLGPPGMWVIDSARADVHVHTAAVAAQAAGSTPGASGGGSSSRGGSGGAAVASPVSSGSSISSAGGWLRSAFGLGPRVSTDDDSTPRAGSGGGGRGHIHPSSPALPLVSMHHRQAPSAAHTGAGRIEGVSEREETIARRLLACRLPFTVPFTTRAALFNASRAADVTLNQAGVAPVRISVSRGPRLFEAAYAALANVRGDAWRRKISVEFVNEHGMVEAGIDAGGLFKELWTSLATLVFNPAYGLWKTTESSATGGGGELYPNPSSALCSGLPDEAAFEFCGRLLGKALYEGIFVGPVFAHFFLRAVCAACGLGSGGVNLHHLPSLDAELYRSLLLIKSLPADTVSDLSLCFTVPAETEGGAEVELVPGGAGTPVTASNRLRYIHLVANWRLNAAMARQTAAFARGLREVVPPAWLSPFSPHELQVLISGSGRAGIDVADLRAHTRYIGFSASDRIIRDFWMVASGLTPSDKAALLRFVTSCERSPPLGFSQLDPPFTIQHASSAGAGALPTASTCFHVLKLPTSYASADALRQKLLMAIHSGAGFELT